MSQEMLKNQGSNVGQRVALADVPFTTTIGRDGRRLIESVTVISQQTGKQGYDDRLQMRKDDIWSDGSIWLSVVGVMDGIEWSHGNIDDRVGLSSGHPVVLASCRVAAQISEVAL